jgi:cytochrome c553
MRFAMMLRSSSCNQTIKVGLMACLLGLASMAWGQGAVQSLRSQHIAAGQALATERCAVCHGEQGQSVAPDFPRLAGQNAAYVLKQLQDFASGHRLSPVMLDKARQLSDEQMWAIGLFYQSMRPTVTLVADPKLAQVGEFVYERGNTHTALPACVTCHGTAARGTAELPRLAGQHPDYIVRQMKAFKDRSRSNDSAIMHLVAERISELELQAVAAYLGGHQ